MLALALLAATIAPSTTTSPPQLNLYTSVIQPLLVNQQTIAATTSLSNFSCFQDPQKLAGGGTIAVYTGSVPSEIGLLTNLASMCVAAAVARGRGAAED